MKTGWQRFAVLLATGFGLGNAPLASGTVGSLLGIPIALALSQAGLAWQIAGAVLLSLAAVPVCGEAERVFGVKDDRRIVADEYLTFPLCMLGLPARIEVFAIAFVVCRAMDVVKPPPAHAAQNLRGGAGIVLDDVISSLYALAVNHLIVRLLPAPAAF